MKDNIPDLLKEKLRKEKAVASKFPIEIKNFMEDYAEYYNWDLSKISKKVSKIQTIYLLMSKGLSELPECKLDGCNNKVYINYHQKLTEGCCHGHSQKISVLEKYGVDTIAKLDSVKNKRRDTCLEKYGETTNLKSSTTKEKIKQTNLEKYGVEHPMQSYEVRKKRSKTFIEKYGSSEITSSQHFKDICIEKFGVENPTLNTDILEKAQNNSYLKKEYKWKTGEISIVQGYEPIILKELEESGYTFNDIFTSPKDMPKIYYMFENKKRRYFPDIYIPKENILIEVKSEWTLNNNLDINEIKFQAVKDAGFNFRLEVR